MIKLLLLGLVGIDIDVDLEREGLFLDVSTVWPLATEMELLTLRCETVGVRLGVPIVEFDAFETWLISCSMSSRTWPLTLIRGMTRRMMPVLR